MTPGNFEPFDYGRSMSIFLADYMYTIPEVSIREMIANCRDQYLHKDTFTRPHYNEVYILLNPAARTFRCIDFATGILALNEFKMMGSNTMGKRVGDRISTVENPDEEMIGQFHVGKASFAKMSELEEGNVVSFYSNSITEGHILQMLIRNTDIGKELGWEDPISRLPAALANEARPKNEAGPGLSVEVHKVIPRLLDAKYVYKVIAEQFGLLLYKKHLRIFIKSENAVPGYEHIADWAPIEAPKVLHLENEGKLKLDANHILFHWLRKEEKPPYENIRICVKGIYIRSIHAPYKVEGTVNNNRLRLNGPRDGFLDDERIEEMHKYLTPYLDANFERLTRKSEKKPKGLKDLTKLFEKMVEECLKLYERDPLMLEGSYQELSTIKGQIIKTDKENLKDLKKEHGKISRNGKGTDEEQNAEGEIVIPVKTKRKPGGKQGGGKGTGGGSKATWTTDQENGKERDYMTGSFDDQRPNRGPINPSFTIDPKDIGIDKPVTYMENAHLLYLNTDQPATRGLLLMQKHYRQTSLGPFMAEALAEFVTRNRQTPTSIREYRQMVNDIYTRSFFSQ